MALTDLQTYAAETDTTFLQRVAVSLDKAAQNIVSEATSTANHGIRVILARAIVSDPDTWAKKFAILVALNANIQAGATLSAAATSDIDTQVSAVWNTFAG